MLTPRALAWETELLMVTFMKSGNKQCIWASQQEEEMSSVWEIVLRSSLTSKWRSKKIVSHKVLILKYILQGWIIPVFSQAVSEIGYSYLSWLIIKMVILVWKHTFYDSPLPSTPYIEHHCLSHVKVKVIHLASHLSLIHFFDEHILRKLCNHADTINEFP